jgi:tyrocidine synthetase-3
MKAPLKKNVLEIMALTPVQEGMLFHYLQNPGDQRYVEQLCLEINGNIDEVLFEKSWNFVAASNEMLRAIFRWEDVGAPVQVILKEHKIKPVYFNLLNKDAAEKIRLSEEIKLNDRKKSFDLRDVPFRVTLCKRNEADYLVTISHHHILYDGWSSGIIVREFFEAYRFCLEKPHLPYHPSLLGKAKFKSFIHWLQNKDIQRADEFWHDYLKDINTSVLPLNTKKEKPAQSRRIGTFSLGIPASLSDRLEKAVKHYNITTAALLYSMWGLLLQRYHAGSDILFDTTTALRPAEIKGIENSAGLFINTLPLRVSTIAGESIRAFLTRIDQMLLRWREFSYIPRHRLNDYLEPYRHNLLFESVLAIENYPLDIAAIQHNTLLKIKSFSTSEITRYDLTVIIILWEGIQFNFTYDADIFSADMLACLGDDVIDILKRLIDPSRENIDDITPGASVFREKRLNMMVRGFPPVPSKVDYAAPRDIVEEKLVDIWSGLFRVEKNEIGLDSNFFDMGGHSLKASLLGGRIYNEFKVKLPLPVVFKGPSIRQLAQYIKTAEKKNPVPIVPVEKKEYYTTSPAQQRMYALQKIAPGSIAYNVSTFFMIEGAIDTNRVKAMECSFNALIERHESLRTSFHVIGAVPVQRIHNENYRLQIVNYDRDGTNIQSEVFAEVQGAVFSKKAPWPPEAIIKLFIRPFDLSRLLLLRTGLVKIAADKHLLMFDAHHIISDGISMNVFVKEFMDFYTGKNIPASRIQYSDFSEWRKKQVLSAEIKQQGTYWLEAFNDEVPLLNFPTDYPRSRKEIETKTGSETGTRTGGLKGSVLYFTVSRDIRRKLLVLEKNSGASLYMILLAAYNVLLMRYSGQEDIVVGTIANGRSHPHLENIIGVLISTLALRNYPYREKAFADFLQEVKANCLAAFENSDYPYEELLKNIRFTRTADRNPLFDTMFLLQNYEWTGLSLENKVFKPYRFDSGASPFDLRVTAVEVDAEIDIEIKYSSRLFEQGTIRRLAGHYVNILQEVADDYGQRLGDILLLTLEEQYEILQQFNEPGRNRGNIEKKPVYRLFADQVLKTPGSTAVVMEDLAAGPCGGEFITYGELNRSVGQIAGLLRQEGLQIGQPAGILLPASPMAAAAVFGVLKAGGTYIPIDPQYPLSRTTGIINDACVHFLLCRGKLVDSGLEKNCRVKIIDMDSRASEMNNPHVGNFDLETDLNMPAYIIYTSGSTGKPRGAAVYQRGLFNLVNWFVTEFTLTGRDSNLLMTSLSFDLTQKNIFAPLVSGGTLFMPGFAHFDPGPLLEIIKKRAITWLNCTPGMIYKMIESPGTGGMEKLASLRYIFLGGEPIEMSMLGKWVGSGYCRAEIVNTYGPTECTDICAYYRVKQPGEYRGDRVPTGGPIYNAFLFILDRSYRVLPVGVPGELFIGGEGVGLGYLNNPELTVEKFNKKFLRGAMGQFFQKKPPGWLRLYQTGDLVKWMSDGNIEFIGRMDFQVKVRGYRIELGEIESRLLAHRDIKAAVVVALERAAGSTASGVMDKYLCAYFVAAVNVTAAVLRKYLSALLPGYMIPSYFFQLAKIPLTSNGKIDRKLLPVPGQDIIEDGEDVEYTAAGNEIEEELIDIWREVLGIERIGSGSNFFRDGGDSLLVIRVIARIRDVFQVEIPVKFFFENPFPAEIAKEIAGRGNRTLRISKAPVGVEIPLTFAQERLWFLNQLDPRSTAYFVPRVLRLKGKLDTGIIKRTFDEIIRRHEILRTVFLTVDGRPVQHVMEFHPIEIPIIDLTHQDDSSQTQEVNEWLSREGQKMFDFETGPLIRVNLLKLKTEEHLLVTTEHHLVHDGWTQGILLKEFIAIFTAYSQGKPSPLPELPIQYKDYAYWQRGYMQGEVLQNHLAYWRKKLEGLAPILNLPLDKPRPPVISGSGAEKRVFLAKELSGQLEMFSRENGATLFMTMLAVFKVLLYRYTGSEDLCVGTGVANRRYKEIEGMLGMVIDTLALRTIIPGELTFTQCLQRVKATCLDAYEHEDTPFEKVVEAVQPERSLSYTPVFQVEFSFMDTPSEVLCLPGLEVRVEPSHNRSSKFDIGIIVEPPKDHRMEETDGKIEMVWEYNTDILSHASIDRMVNHYNRLVEEIVIRPGRKLSALQMLTNEEIHQLINDFNHTVTIPRQNKPVHRLFEEQVRTSPDSTAIVSREKWVTYKKLNENANKLAYHLVCQGAKPGSIIALMTEPSIAVIIGILGILKSGGAYMPIDLAQPVERKISLFKNSQARFVLIHKHLLTENRDIFQSLGIENIFIDDNSIYPGTGSDIDIAHEPNDLIYIIHTSGTTGNPRGIMIEHRNVSAAISWFTNRYDIKKNAKVLQLTNISFDVSVEEIFGALTRGATLYLPGKEISRDKNGLIEYIEKNNIDIAQFVPSMLKAFLADASRIDCLKVVISGGDTLEESLKNDLIAKGYELHNHYGPTEITIDATAARCDRSKVVIGKPIAGVQLYILFESDLVPVGVPGELCISGPGLARGYLNEVELTRSKFVDSPFDLLKKMYRSGDIARWLPDGNIEFLGRNDRQVKIRGIRIELREIESQLVWHRDIKEAVVLAKEDGNTDKYLCAFIVSTKEIDARELKKYLSAKLPDFMNPSYFVRIDRLPLKTNGKIDEKALPWPGVSCKSPAYIAPRPGTEEKLAGIWQKILKIEANTISIDDNFFQRGGHSLNAAILAAKIHEKLDVKITVSDIFKHATLRDMAECIDRNGKEKYESIKIAELKEYYALSAAQRRLYIIREMDRQETGYNITSLFRLPNNTDINRLEKIFNLLLKRHESLATSFRVIAGEIVQRIHRYIDLKIELFSASVKNPIEQYIKRFIRPFDLSSPPAMRVGVIKQEGSGCILMLDIHHIISDGVSMEILARDFMYLYAENRLPGLKVQYKDFSIWQNQRIKEGAYIKQEDYWRRKFEKEFPILHLPVDFVRPTIQSFAGSRLSFEISPENTCRLNSLAKMQGATLFMVLLAVFNILLAKITNQEDIAVGIPIASRRHSELENVIGMFVNTLVLKNQLTGYSTFRDFLLELKENTLEAYENQDYPFDEIVEKVGLKRDTSRNPLFDVMFVLQNIEMSNIEIQGLHLVPYDYEMKTAKFDLTLIVIEQNDRLNLTFEYSVKLFKKESIERFIRYFKRINSSVLENPAGKIAGIEIISPEEKRQILEEFNRTTTEYPKGKSIIELFVEKAAKIPDLIALEGQSPRCASVTYRELNEKSGLLSHWLVEKGVAADSIVAIMVKRSLEMVTGVYGILKAGGAYLPIDPDYPEERKQYMLADSGVQILISDKDDVETGYCPVLTYTLTQLSQYIRHIHLTHLTQHTQHPHQTCKNLAYIIYTSGSTGKPKGVMLEQGNLFNIIMSLSGKYPFTGEDVFLLKTSFLFDVSVTELFGWFLGGGRLAILALDGEKDPRVILEAIARGRITHINFVPTMFAAFISILTRQNISELSTLKYIFSAGEVLPPGVVKSFYQSTTGVAVENLYGPTEAAVYTSGYSSREWNGDGSIPIGKPMKNVKLYIFNTDGNLQPPGITGELYIAGAGIARGYLNNPGLTAEKFVISHLSPGISSSNNRSKALNDRLYQTGDLAKWLPDGNIEFLGRIDNQVKIRGYRIELGEIQTRLMNCAKIKEAVVIVRERINTGAGDLNIKYPSAPGNDKCIFAYICAEEGLDIIEVKNVLLKELPRYMIPDYFIKLGKMPLTTNGKINIKALPEPGYIIDEKTIAPRNDIEAILLKIWQKELCLKQIGVLDDFFNIGGHSMRALNIINKIYIKFGVKLSFQHLFKNPTIAKLAIIINGNRNCERSIMIEKQAKKEYYLTSVGQRRLWKNYKHDPGNPDRNIQTTYTFNEKINENVLREIFKKLVDRHESLHTYFKEIAGEPVQIIDDVKKLDFEVIDLTHIKENKKITTRDQIFNNDIMTPFNLEIPPLCRLKLIKFHSDEFHIAFTINHIAADGWSLDLLKRDFFALYDYYKKGIHYEPGPLKFQYKDYAAWHHKILSNETQITGTKNYWKKHMKGEISIVTLPYDYEISGPVSSKSGMYRTVIDENTTRDLKAIADKQQTSLFMILFSVLNVLVAGISGKDEIIIGIPNANRQHEDFKNVFGYFVGPVIVKNQIDEGTSFENLLEIVTANTFNIFKQHMLPLEYISDLFKIEYDWIELLSVFYNMTTFGDSNQSYITNFDSYHIENCQDSKFKFVVYPSEYANGIDIKTFYFKQFYKPSTIEKFMKIFVRMVVNISTDPVKKIKEVFSLLKESPNIKRSGIKEEE